MSDIETQLVEMGENNRQLRIDNLELKARVAELEAVLKAVSHEIQQAKDADEALFWKLGLDESEKWDQPSRNLQTFGYVLQEIDRAINPE